MIAHFNQSSLFTYHLVGMAIAGFDQRYRQHIHIMSPPRGCHALAEQGSRPLEVVGRTNNLYDPSQFVLDPPPKSY
jgi:hypothetical protein